MKAKVELYEAPQRSEAEFWSEVEFGYSVRLRKILNVFCFGEISPKPRFTGEGEL